MIQKLLALYCFCLISTFAFGQFIPNSFFQNPLPVNCPASGGTYMGFDEWSAFQTTDSSVWGPRDSACFDIGVSGQTSLRIDLGQTNPALPIFVQSNLDTTNMILLAEDGLYKLFFELYCPGGVLPAYLGGTNCPDDLCSGLSLGVEVPDSAGTGHTIRWYTGEITPYGNYLRAEFCFPTERFPAGNFVRHTWWRLGQAAVNTGSVLENVSTYFLDDLSFTVVPITEILAPGNYAYVGGGFPGNNALVMYTAPTYPDAQHLSYVEVLPDPNVATPQQITVEIPFNSTLNYQPFVQLRGGQVLGDTLRHSFTLLNNGGTICNYNFIDLIFNGDDGYTHRAGHLDMNGPMACMSFGRGGTLRVEDGAILQYGRPGNGMIALRTGGRIEIGERAELRIGGSLVIGEYKEETEPQTFAIHLRAGGKLTFDPGSHLRNFFSKFPEATVLDVYLEGGTLDDTGLPMADRALIRRHYGSLQDELADNLHMAGNPFEYELQAIWDSRAGIPFSATLLGMDGRELLQQEAISLAGSNAIRFETGSLPSGIYLLRVETPYGNCTKRVMRR